MTAPHLRMEYDLTEPDYRAEPLRRAAALLRSIGRPADAEELEQSAAVETVLGMSSVRLAHFQELRINPPRRMTRGEWKWVKCEVRTAQQGFDWLLSHGCLPSPDDLLVRALLSVLQAAGQGKQPLRLVRGTGEALDRISSHCVAISLAEQEPLDGHQLGGRRTRPAGGSYGPRCGSQAGAGQPHQGIRRRRRAGPHRLDRSGQGSHPAGGGMRRASCLCLPRWCTRMPPWRIYSSAQARALASLAAAAQEDPAL